MHIRKIAVLGAGVMGAQIAAHCANAGYAVLLFDLENSTPPTNAIALKAIAHLAKLKPAPLGNLKLAATIQPCDYAKHLALLQDCDLVIEAIAERMEWKKALYERIAPYLAPEAILVSNTSGLKINALATILSVAQQARFCGVHFFNPPRYMRLVELIPAVTTDGALLDDLETWLTRYLGKGVVRAKDTPNFIANRIGVFSLLITLYHAERLGLGMDEVDALTGTLIGRPKSATCRTMDVVGLDTLRHVVNTMHEQLAHDPWHALYQLPDWILAIIEQGHLGQKTGQGIYRKQGKTIEVFDLSTQAYRPANGKIAPSVQAILKLPDAAARWQNLITCPHPQAQFLCAYWRDLWHYCSVHLEDIAETVRDVDRAMQWGFGWQQGPFEAWQAYGVNEIKAGLIDALDKRTLFSSVSLPSWLNEIKQFYTANEAWSPQAFVPPSVLPVYQRQIKLTAKDIWSNAGVAIRHLPHDILLVNFTTKANTINHDVIDGVMHALEQAEREAQGLIIYQTDPNNFSAGADLHSVSQMISTDRMDDLAHLVECFQSLVMRLKYSSVPTVAAVRGRALGGGCELMMHCSAIVAGYEFYPGLVELGVGLIPAGGGCKEMARRAAQQGSEMMAYVRSDFEQIAMAKVAGSAYEAKQMNYMQPSDAWVMHNDEVLYAAIAKIQALQALNYRPPVSTLFKVAGREGYAQLQLGLVNWLEGGYISEHDYFIANQLAHVMCGGEVYQNTEIDEKWLLNLEKAAFMTLAAHPLTQARIKHLLETGKPLRN